jgi:hypothetical protein
MAVDPLIVEATTERVLAPVSAVAGTSKVVETIVLPVAMPIVL